MENDGAWKQMLDRPIAFHRAFVGLTGSVTAALFLSQALYWHLQCEKEVALGKREDTWFWKIQEQWEQETGLNRREQDSARKRLKDLGFIVEERRGTPAKLWFFIDEEALQNAMQGGLKPLSAEEIVDLFSARLSALSAGHYHRAKELSVETEFVDLAEVLIKKGAICHLCGKPITRGPGRKGEFLNFDHKIPLCKSGSHTFENVYPSHAKCNHQKGDGSRVQTRLLGNEQSRLLGTVQSRLLGTVQPIKEAETTSETTTETTENPSDSLRSPEGVQSDEPSKKTEKPKPKSKTDPPDERHTPVREFIQKCWLHANKSSVTAPWAGPEAKMLSQVLRENPGWTIEQFLQCVRNRFRSQVNNSEEPRRWLPRLASYFGSPLDRFGQPLPTAGRRATDPEPKYLVDIVREQFKNGQKTTAE